eukprot:CAMPEP_0172664264 /NCGR_PEP_ID=MMETSP1074-20121228/6480_1 /TAXON_ID=2916 /ORGANISM="Ceratium fusus, Strain PA161109" /LENGTH=39 /DNA_ID= /DNA_START= /DNA_END= /DNA_ORIENTATION=
MPGRLHHMVPLIDMGDWYFLPQAIVPTQMVPEAGKTRQV